MAPSQKIQCIARAAEKGQAVPFDAGLAKTQKPTFGFLGFWSWFFGGFGSKNPPKTHFWVFVFFAAKGVPKLSKYR